MTNDGFRFNRRRKALEGKHTILVDVLLYPWAVGRLFDQVDGGTENCSQPLPDSVEALEASKTPWSRFHLRREVDIGPLGGLAASG